MNTPITLPFVSKVVSTYQGATKGLQNYGKNIGKNMAQETADFRSGKAPYNATRNPFPNPLKASSYK